MQLKFDAVKKQLAQSPPISEFQRTLWKGAAQHSRETHPRKMIQPQRRLWMPAAAALAACILFVILGPFHHAKPIDTNPSRQNPVATEQQIIHPETVAAIDAKQGLSDLAAATDRLDAELEALRAKAQKDEAKRQVAVALDRFGRW